MARRCTSTAGPSTRTSWGRRQGHLQAEPGTLLGPETLVIAQPDIDDWPPAVSPDGRALLPERAAGRQRRRSGLVERQRGLSPAPFSATAGGDSTASGPRTGRRSSTRSGRFGDGDLALRDHRRFRSVRWPAMNVADHFDGNADWATNFSAHLRPEGCRSAFNCSRRIGLSCTDPDSGSGAPPRPRPRSNRRARNRGRARHGTIGALSQRPGDLHARTKTSRGPTCSRTRAPMAPRRDPGDRHDLGCGCREGGGGGLRATASSIGSITRHACAGGATPAPVVGADPGSV